MRTTADYPAVKEFLSSELIEMGSVNLHRAIQFSFTVEARRSRSEEGEFETRPYKSDLSCALCVLLRLNNLISVSSSCGRDRSRPYFLVYVFFVVRYFCSAFILYPSNNTLPPPVCHDLGSHNGRRRLSGPGAGRVFNSHFLYTSCDLLVSTKMSPYLILRPRLGYPHFLMPAMLAAYVVGLYRERQILMDATVFPKILSESGSSLLNGMIP